MPTPTYIVTVAVIDKAPVTVTHTGRAAAVERACVAYWALSVGLCPEEEAEAPNDPKTQRFFEYIKYGGNSRLSKSPRNRAFTVTLEKVLS